jgi:hypothetical protein
MGFDYVAVADQRTRLGLPVRDELLAERRCPSACKQAGAWRFDRQAALSLASLGAQLLEQEVACG